MMLSKKTLLLWAVTLVSLAVAILSVARMWQMKVPDFEGRMTWEYDHGWTKGATLIIDGSKNLITYHDRETATKRSRSMMNGRQLIAYFDAILQQIPEQEIGRKAIDGVTNKVSLLVDDRMVTRTIYMVDPPSAVIYNESYPAADDLEVAARFSDDVYGFLACDMFRKLRAEYFEG